MSVFLGYWSSIEDLQRDFCNPAPGGYNIIVAGYDTYSYEGYAYVLAESGGQLFECAGSHCSCYGLEGQWAPAPVTREYLRQRLENGRFSGVCCDSSNEIADAVRKYLDETA